MARNQERKFSESENLNAVDWEREAADVLPVANRAGGGAPDASEREEGKNASPEGKNEATAQESRRTRAEKAWNQEAKRVESTQQPYARRDRDEADAEGKKPPRGTKKTDTRKKKNKNDREERRSFVKTLVIVAVCVFMFLTVALMVLSNFVSHPLLALPRKMVTSIITPVQRVFATVTDSVVEYLRRLKIRGNLEYEYEKLTLLLDEYANDSAQIEELRRINESLYDLLDEQKRNRQMNPVAATVIGTDSANYFSVLTLDVGSENGVEPYMAVVAQGGLVGVTYNVEKNKCQVRCVIDSDCTVAALIQSSRDQGSVKGTIGVNGEPMCRMYYLPDNSLPRPGDVVVTSGVGLEFPKGIPIGYVRESTRGMEDNKSYVVVEPVVDFQHLEYVTVYRYKPAYAESAQSREVKAVTSLEPLSTPRPVPTWQEGVGDTFHTNTPGAPTATPAGQTAAPSAQPTDTPNPAATNNPNATQRPENLQYQTAPAPDSTTSPTPRPTFTPTPSPVPTPDPGGMHVEED